MSPNWYISKDKERGSPPPTETLAGKLINSCTQITGGIIQKTRPVLNEIRILVWEKGCKAG